MVDHVQSGVAVHLSPISIVHDAFGFERTPHSVNVQISDVGLLRVLSDLVPHSHVSINELLHLVLDVDIVLVSSRHSSQSTWTHAPISSLKRLRIVDWRGLDETRLL